MLTLTMRNSCFQALWVVLSCVSCCVLGCAADNATAVDSGRDAAATLDASIGDVTTVDAANRETSTNSDALVQEDADASAPDASDPTVPVVVDGRTLSCRRQGAPYALDLGASFPAITLPRCDGTSYRLYNQEFCDSRLTMIVFASGSSGASRDQARTLQAGYIRRFANCGLRVVSILLESDTIALPSQSFCESWTSTYGLTSPVLRDDGSYASMFPGMNVPATILMDRVGHVAFRQDGVGSASSTLALVRALLIQAGANLQLCEVS